MRIMTSEAFPRWALFPPTEADKRVWKDHGPLEMAPVHFHDFWKAGVYIYIYISVYGAGCRILSICSTSLDPN